MRSLVKDYQDAAYAQDSSLADQKYRAAQDLMFPQDGSTPDCQSSLMEAYLTSSIMVSHPIDPKAGVLDMLLSTGDLFSHNDEIGMVVESLFDSHQIKFLSEKFREQKKGRWLMKDHDGNYLSTGAYDCDTTTIYVDPTLRPFDEAVSIFHEISHLARDKTTQTINPEYIHNGKVDWRAYNLDDEVSGVIFSAAAQADLQDIYYKNKSSSNFQVAGDLSFFSNGGLMYQIFRSNQSKPCKMNYGKNGCGFGQTFRARTDSVIAAQLFYSMDQLFKPAQLDTYAQVRKTIWNAYFVNSVGSEDVSSEPPPQPKNRVDANGLGLDELYINGAIYPNPYPSPAKLIGLFNRNKSYVCTLYEKDMLAGNITRYLGSEFQDEVAPEENSSPAPKSMLKPCLRFGNIL